MIIDVHAHYTQAPAQLDAYRGKQLSNLNRPLKGSISVSDEQITKSVQENLKQMRDKGLDRLVLSPRASGMGHDFGSELISRYWTEVNNDLIGRVCRMFPDKFVPCCQLPQTPGVGPGNCVEELERCVKELGFVACNINPDVSGGVVPFTPSLGDEWWYPLWEKMVELDVPGMIHASSTLNPALHLLGSHYTNQHNAAVVELCNSRVYDDFPTLKLIIPHGGGAVPYQFNRHRALHVREKRRPFEEMVRHLYFDMAIYDQD
jgi:4-oxalmesaconate hydratase